MIERKRGHIVAVSSLSAKVASFKILAYIATKYGNDGFMRALYDDLCLDGHDEYIKLTTVYPAFFTTQKKLQDVLNTACADMPMYDPKDAGELIVKGMLKNRREFIVPFESSLLLFLR
jgi:all-trans-retinol dehydrogenase (NAD+)